MNILFQNLLVGVGLYGELRFNPVYKNYFTLGVQLGGAFGKSPYSLDGVYRNINDGELFEDYNYKRWNYGIEVAVGSKPIKIIGIFQRNLQYNDYHAVLQTAGRTDQQISFDKTMLWETVGLGLRIGDQTDRKKAGYVDLIFTLTKEQNNFTGRIGLEGRPFDIQGISLNFWQNNRIGLGLDVRMFKSEDNPLDFKMESSTLQFTFKYNLVKFLNEE